MGVRYHVNPGEKGIEQILRPQKNPIIQFIPRSEEAGEYWDHFEWALHQPNLFELKRDRAHVRWEPIEA